MSYADRISALGLPPDASDPQGQLDWLVEMVKTLETVQDARVKPIRKRVRKLLQDFKRNAKLGKAPEEIGEHFARQVREVQIEAFSIVLRLTQQIKGGIQVKLKAESVEPEASITDLLTRITEFSSRLRRLISAMKKRDAEAEARVREEFAAATKQ